MTDCAIIYFSGTGVTQQLARAIELGAQRGTDGEVAVCRILGEHIEQGRYVHQQHMELLDNADIIFFGSPTYMGGPAAQFKAFADASSERWESQQWAGKLAAGFTSGSNAGGDQLATLQYFHILASQHGMYWVGLDRPADTVLARSNTLGTQLGVSVHALDDQISKDDRINAEYLGRRGVTAARRMRR